MNDQHRIVSSESEELILVDSDDNEIGYASKAEAHDGGGIRHRAFSLFLFNDEGELLLQQRAPSKRLWGGFWSNSCCSHPRRGESLAVATVVAAMFPAASVLLARLGLLHLLCTNSFLK